MNYDQVALFLSSCTTPGFRRSLSMSAIDTLQRCGFHANEASILAASLGQGTWRPGRPQFGDITFDSSEKKSIRREWFSHEQ
jgi:hypothetical protein